MLLPGLAPSAQLKLLQAARQIQSLSAGCGIKDLSCGNLTPIRVGKGVSASKFKNGKLRFLNFEALTPFHSLTVTVEGPTQHGGAFHHRVVFGKYEEARPEMSTLTIEELRTVSPALDRYKQDRLLGDLWKRPDRSPRDRGMVTVAVLIARSQPVEMPYYFDRALENGVKHAGYRAKYTWYAASYVGPMLRP